MEPWSDGSVLRRRDTEELSPALSAHTHPEKASDKLAVCKPRRQSSLETYPDVPASRTPSLQNYEREKKKQFCCLSRPVCDDLLWQPGRSNQSLLWWPQFGNQEGYRCKFIPLVWGFLPKYCFLSILQPNLMEQCENYQKCATHAHTTLLTTVSLALLLLSTLQKDSERNFTAKESTVDP